MAVGLVAAGLLTGCGGESDGKAAGTADRQAAVYKATELCLQDETYEFSKSVRFGYHGIGENTNGNGNGPFPLRGGWCGVNRPKIIGTVVSASGTNVLQIDAENRDINYPKASVVCRPGAGSDPAHAVTTHRFSEGETFSVVCSPYRVEVTRLKDTDVKHFRAVVERA